MDKHKQIKEWVRQIVNYHHEGIPDPHKMLIICNKCDYDCWVDEFSNAYGFKMYFRPHLPTQFFDTSTGNIYEIYNERHVRSIACVRGQRFNVLFISEQDRIEMSRDARYTDCINCFCLAEGLDWLQCQSWQVVELTENKITLIENNKEPCNGQYE